MFNMLYNIPSCTWLIPFLKYDFKEEDLDFVSGGGTALRGLPNDIEFLFFVNGGNGSIKNH